MSQDYPFQTLANALPDSWKLAVQNALTSVNPLVSSIQNLASLDPEHCPDARLILRDSGTSEIAAIMSFDNTIQSQIKSRTLVIQQNNVAAKPWQIPTVSRLWEPLVYPLLFPQGTLRWGIVGTAHEIQQNQPLDDEFDAPTTQMWFYRARLLREHRFAIFGRLTNEYIIDMFTRDLESRLAYIRNNQMRIRAEDAALMGVDEVDASEDVYLPASFLGSKRWASEQIANSLAIASAKGPPTFFVMMICNGKWPESQRNFDLYSYRCGACLQTEAQFAFASTEDHVRPCRSPCIHHP